MNDGNAIRDLDRLIDSGLVSPQARSSLEPVAKTFAIGVSAHMRRKIESDPTGPLARQLIPSTDEALVDPAELEDPIGDSAHSPVRGLVHRYPDRVLILPTLVCPVYCRFCFRREVVGAGGAVLEPSGLDAAFDYVCSNPTIREVILTGGDPLVLSSRRLAEILDRADAVGHVDVVRIHSRVPVMDPARVDDDLVRILSDRRAAVYLGIHANHPDEFGVEEKAAIARLRRAGVILLSQSVLLSGINDDVETLSRLMRDFVSLGIRPYYLHHLDLARGTGHFRVPLDRGRALVEALRGHLSGLCQPTYVLDIPGGHGKVPITADFVEALGHGTYRIRDPWGRWHDYRDPAG